jgi:hypothetical protein
VRMVKTVAASVSLCAASLLATGGHALANDTHEQVARPRKNKCDELSGPFTSSVGSPCTSPVGLCTHGTLQGDLPAQYDFKFFYTGTSVITANNGTLYTYDTGVIHMLPENAPSPFVTTATIIDGTGKYKKRRGEFVATGMLQFGNATGSYAAELCKVADAE